MAVPEEKYSETVWRMISFAAPKRKVFLQTM